MLGEGRLQARFSIDLALFTHMERQIPVSSLTPCALQSWGVAGNGTKSLILIGARLSCWHWGAHPLCLEKHLANH